ncbi:hypothetical protein BGZ46_005713 [Entomortierella lignicola]|nr:hypothetical protein BGZ46_005713 [Entomortierella lignicola]
MTSLSSSRSRRSAKDDSFTPTPPPPPPGHPSQSVHAFSMNSAQLQFTNHPDQRSSYTRDSPSPGHSQGRPRSGTTGTTGKEQQENWADNSWRSIFDAALVKAQQAVQLDELGESALAANLYAQAANDLGRVIPMCGSEKKKQSMLAIQAVYLDRVLQLKPGALTKSAHNQSSPLSQQKSQAHDSRHSYNNKGGQYNQEGRYTSQEIYQFQDPNQYRQRQAQHYQPPPPTHHLQHNDINDRAIVGKKRSKTLLSSQPTEHMQESHSTNNSNNSYGSYNTHAEYNNNFGSNAGYISPNFNNSTGPPTPSPVAAPSPTPPALQPIEQQELTPSSSKISRWKPFGKKKSKSFSAGEGNNPGPFYPPSNYETPSVPAMPMDIQQQPYSNFVDPAIQTDLFSQQQKSYPGWDVDRAASPSLIDEYEQLTQNYDDDEEDIDPYYIADVKGRARAFEGKDLAKIKPPPTPAPAPVEDSKKSRPAPKHNASSYSNEKSFTPTFPTGNYSQGSVNQPTYPQEPETPAPIEPTSPIDYAQEYPDLYHNGNYENQEYQQHYQQQDQQPYHQQAFVDQTPYEHDPNLTKVEPTPEPQQPTENETDEKSKSKGKWFGKKKAKEAPVETFDEVAKLMDEALFGGGFASSSRPKKNKDKKKEKSKKDKEKETGRSLSVDTQSQISSEALSPRSQTEYDGGNTLVGNGAENQYQNPDSPALQHLPEFNSVSENSALQSPVAMYTPPESLSPMFLQFPEAPQTPRAFIPVPYAPKTTYTPPPKKQQQQTEDAISEPTPVLQDSNSEQQQQPVSDSNVGDTPDTSKKSKNPFNLFKSKKSSNKASIDQDSVGDDSKSTHSDKARKGSIQSNDNKAIDAASAIHSKDNTRRESLDYIPYEYQEDLEGPLMERVQVNESHDMVGFVTPVEDKGDGKPANNDQAALDSWDSWVNQLESFEKVLKKGLKKNKKEKKEKKEKEKKPKKTKAEKDLEREMMKDDHLSILLAPPIKTKRSSTHSNSTDNYSTTTANELHDNRPSSVGDDLSRQSFVSTHSSAVLGHDLNIQQASMQQAKRRWWNPKRKETTSVYSVAESFAVSEYDQETYLNTLLEKNEEKDELQDTINEEQTQEQQHTEIENGAEHKNEKELEAHLKNEKDAEPLPQVEPVATSTTSTQEIPSVVGAEEFESTANSKDPRIPEDPEDRGAIAKEVTASATTLKPKPSKSGKSKLMPISTPLAQLLKLSNPEELWQYVQQAKTYATNRMNKGDKRSAATALKRAQALEARWQEVLLEMASSDENDDELLEDDDDEEEEESEQEALNVVEKKPKAEIKKSPEVDITTAKASDEPISVVAEKEKEIVPVLVTATVAQKQVEAEDDDYSDDEEIARKRLHVRKVTSRSENVPDMYSKYKVNKSPAVETESKPEDSADVNESSEKTAEEDTQEDGRLGADATLEQMLATTNVEHLQFYIQRLKTETVAKARSGSKLEALEGMKNVKTLQRRLAELEEGDDDEEEERGDDNGGQDSDSDSEDDSEDDKE